MHVTNQNTNAELIEEDIWQLPELRVDFTSWTELTTTQKWKRVFLHYILKITVLLCALYIFVCSLSFLGDAFQLLGVSVVPVQYFNTGKAAGEVFTKQQILANPVAGVMIGVIATVLLQSSSTTTSIIVSMVGSGDLLTVRQAIPIIMGANIGTSITNTIVSIGQITNKDNFRRAFAGATVHDVFNWLTVVVLLPVEILSRYLEKLSKVIVESFDLVQNTNANRNYLNVITQPFTELIIQIDKDVIKKIATEELKDYGQSIIKHNCCDTKMEYVNATINETTTLQEKIVKLNCKSCVFMFEYVSRGKGWSDALVGGILLVIALVLLCACLVGIVKLLNSLLRGQIAHLIRRFVNSDLPGKCSYFTGYIAIAIGAGITLLLQSSSIFTSSLTPLVGIGVLSLERMYPLTLGSNIGTCATGILAAFAQDPKTLHNALQIALCHMLFNMSGTLIWYPFPFFRPPINAAKFLGVQVSKYRWFALVYLIFAFLLIPAAGFGLSLLSWIALTTVFVPIAVLFFIIFVMKFIQRKCPMCLPVKLRNWKWLPKFLRSLAPCDHAVTKAVGVCLCCRKLRCCHVVPLEDDVSKQEYVNMNNGNNTLVTSDNMNGDACNTYV